MISLKASKKEKGQEFSVTWHLAFNALHIGFQATEKPVVSYCMFAAVL